MSLHPQSKLSPIERTKKNKAPNDATLEAYNDYVEHYIQATPSEYNSSHQPLLDWFDDVLNRLPIKEASILEIGSGAGRDARYIRSKGFRIITSDGSKAFVDYLRSIGEEPLLLNILTDKIPGHYDMLLANAVITHFTTADFATMLVKSHKALKANGFLCITARQGDGISWPNEKSIPRRYLKKWQPHELKTFVRDYGFEIIYEKQDIKGDLPDHTWIHITARKIAAAPR